MGGSGGGGGGSSDVSRILRQVERELDQQEIDADLNEHLGEMLKEFNSRDVEVVNERLEAISDVLGGVAIDVEKLLFGGSVAKHTYVNGLSDVDALVVLEAPDASPADLVRRFASALSAQLTSGEVTAVVPGRLAVTVTYRDGMEIQLLPAVERGGRTSIASSDGKDWRYIRPHKFAEKLTQVNKSSGGGVVPTIKLAKALLGRLPGSQQLSGYHVEAIAVDAFKRYGGRRDRVSMLNHLIRHAANAIMRPTGDITGQTVHIDTHLGGAGSEARRAISAKLGTLASALEGARGVHEYQELFDG